MAELVPGRGQGAQTPARSGEHPLRRFFEEFEGLFQQFFGGLRSAGGGEQTGLWNLDVDENGEEIVVRAEAPGFEPDEFDIHVTGNTLTIRAEHKQEEKQEQRGYSFAQQRRFLRTVPLSSDVDVDKVEARYRNGVLEIHLPRTEQMQKKRIEVKTRTGEARP
jgi:HSP20 family molecular chaperone IbpA